jgi:hypothetical protein
VSIQRRQAFAALTNTYKEHQMRTVRNIALAAAAALTLGSAAFAQDAAKPGAKSEASEQHRGEHRQHGMKHPMREMRGGCHGESRGASREEHDHS